MNPFKIVIKFPPYKNVSLIKRELCPVTILKNGTNFVTEFESKSFSNLKTLLSMSFEVAIISFFYQNE